MDSNLETREETVKKIRKKINSPDRAEIVVKFADNFGASYKTVGHKQSKGKPQERSKALRIFPKVQDVGRQIL